MSGARWAQRPPGLGIDVDSWSVEDVCAWLEAVDCGSAREAFTEHRIFGVVLLMMTEADLKEVLGSAAGCFGLRKMILIARDWLKGPGAGGTALRQQTLRAGGCHDEAGSGGQGGTAKCQVSGSRTAVLAASPPLTPRLLLDGTNANGAHRAVMATMRNVCAGTAALIVGLVVGLGANPWFLSWASHPLYTAIKVGVQEPC